MKYKKAIAREVLFIQCDNCDENLTTCDSCKKDIDFNEKIYCDTIGYKHICKKCFLQLTLDKTDLRKEG